MGIDSFGFVFLLIRIVQSICRISVKIASVGHIPLLLKPMCSPFASMF